MHKRTLSFLQDVEFDQKHVDMSREREKNVESNLKKVMTRSEKENMKKRKEKKKKRVLSIAST